MVSYGGHNFFILPAQVYIMKLWGQLFILILCVGCMGETEQAMIETTLPSPTLLETQPPIDVSLVTEEIELKHDDGRMENSMSMGGRQYVVSFSPSTKPFEVRKVKIYGKRYGTYLTELIFSITILDQDFNVLSQVTDGHDRFDYNSYTWMEVDIPTIVTGDFFVIVDMHSKRDYGISVGIDESVKNAHSDEAAEGRLVDWDIKRPKDTTNWMIRVIGSTQILESKTYVPPTQVIDIKGKFTPEIKIEGDEEFVQNVEHILEVYHEYSPEWHEKTMIAGEFIVPSDMERTSSNGTLQLNRSYVLRLGKDSDVKEILRYTVKIPHEIQHIVDLNLEPNKYRELPFAISEMHKFSGFELELRAGLASEDYCSEIGFCYSSNKNYFCSSETSKGHHYSIWKNQFDRNKQEIDQEKYKEELDAIEEKYFDHENKRLKTDLLNETWEAFMSCCVEE